MRNLVRKVLTVIVLMGAAASVSVASDLWLHVRVDEAEGAKVSVNLPLSMVEKALPMIPEDHLEHGRLVFDDWQVTMEELRDLWQEVKAGPDMTFVTVEDGDQQVRVWKEGDYFLVSVREDEDTTKVDVRVPSAVVDALLSGEGSEMNLHAAIEALVDSGEGELVTVSDANNQVRVWVDRSAETE